MKKLIYILTFLLLISLVTAQEVNITGNLGEKANHKFNISLNPSQEAYINLISHDSRILHQYTNVVNSTNSVVDINLTIDSIFTQNATLISTFEITNNESSTPAYYNLTIHVQTNSTTGTNSNQNLSIIEGNFTANLTEDQLPYNQTLEFKIGGKSNATLNISCNAEWLSCPNQTTFNQDGNANIQIELNIPHGTQIGNYTLPIFFSTTNQSLTNYIFIILRKEEVTFQPYIFGDECTTTINGTIFYTSTCVYDMTEYYLKVAKELTEKLNAEINATCLAQTEYIVAGNVSKMMVDELDLCKSDRDSYKGEMDSCNANLQTCNNKFLNNESQCWNNIWDYKKDIETDAKTEIEGNEKNVRSFAKRIYALITILVLIGVGVFLYFYYKKHNKEVVNFG